MLATLPHLADGFPFPGQRITILPPSVVRRAQELPVCRGLHVTHLGRFDRAKGHFVERPHGRPEYLLHICLQGWGEAAIGKRCWRLQRGQAIFMPPNVAHWYNSSPDEPWTLFWFHFFGLSAADFVQAAGATADNPIVQFHNVELLTEAFEECYQHVLGGYTDADLFGLSTAFARLLGLLRTQRRSANSRTLASEDAVLRSIRYMRDNLNKALTLTQIAEKIALSVSQYSAVFSRQMKCGPMEFLTRLKLQRACEQLETSRYSVAEIAYEVGFEDPLYFSRRFRQQIGLAPSDYRRKAGYLHRGGSAASGA